MKRKWLPAALLCLLFVFLPFRPSEAKTLAMKSDGYNTYFVDLDSASEDYSEGSVYIDGSYYTFYTGWRSFGGKWYYFDSSWGGMYTDGFLYDGTADYYMGKDGVMKTGWIAVKEDVDGYGPVTVWYYANPDGKLAQGWKKLGGKWYYFDPAYHSMYADSLLYQGGKVYYLGPDGDMKTGWIRYSYENKGGDSWVTWYYAGSDGVLMTGWKQIGGVWYYFDPDSCAMAADTIIDYAGSRYSFNASGAMRTNSWGSFQWTMEDGSVYTDWYYAGADGKLVKGWKTIGGKRYYFDPDNCWMYANDAYDFGMVVYLFDKDGQLVTKPGWVKFWNIWYYAKGDGTAYIGWRSEGGHQYYLAPELGQMETSARVIDGVLYVFNSAGWNTGTVTKAGWYAKDGIWYYVNGSGQGITGWAAVGGKQYFFDESGRMQTGPYRDETAHKVYFLKSDGSLANTAGWKKVAQDGWDEWYYTDASGVCRTGWLKLGGKWYYFDPDYAYMYADCSCTIDGTLYQFDADGSWMP